MLSQERSNLLGDSKGIRDSILSREKQGISQEGILKRAIIKLETELMMKTSPRWN